MPLTENQIKKRRDIIADKKHSFKWAPLYRGVSKAEKYNFIHAVTDADRNGARQSACGIIARFVPNSNDWGMFDNSTHQCPDCKELTK